jgi:hypothetical protein
LWTDGLENLGQQLNAHERVMTLALCGKTAVRDIVETEFFDAPERRLTLMVNAAPFNDANRISRQDMVRLSGEIAVAQIPNEGVLRHRYSFGQLLLDASWHTRNRDKFREYIGANLDEQLVR